MVQFLIDKWYSFAASVDFKHIQIEWNIFKQQIFVDYVFYAETSCIQRNIKHLSFKKSKSISWKFLLTVSI